jgi:hypothetical protein
VVDVHHKKHAGMAKAVLIAYLKDAAGGDEGEFGSLLLSVEFLVVQAPPHLGSGLAQLGVTLDKEIDDLRTSDASGRHLPEGAIKIRKFEHKFFTLMITGIYFRVIVIHIYFHL